MTLQHDRNTGPIPVTRLHRRDIQRTEVGWVAFFHLAGAAVMMIAPRGQVIGPSTQAIFGFLPVPFWASWFAVTGVLAVAATRRGTSQRLARLWVMAFPLMAAWVAGFTFGVVDGQGNVLGLLVWVSHLVWWASLALRLRGRQGARWGGS